MSALSLRHGLSFEDLYTRDGLSRLDAAFVSALADVDVALHNRLLAARTAPDALNWLLFWTDDWSATSEWYAWTHRH